MNRFYHKKTNLKKLSPSNDGKLSMMCWVQGMIQCHLIALDDSSQWSQMDSNATRRIETFCDTLEKETEEWSSKSGRVCSI